MANWVSRSRPRLALVFLLAAVLFTTGIATGPTRAVAADPPPRGKMFRLTNDDRAAKDRRALDLNARLSRYAQRHSRAMANRGGLFHTSNLAGKLDGFRASVGGENVGVGASLPALESAFMASTPHRRNILKRRFRHVAIGVVESNGRFWVTVIFYG